MLSPVLYKLKKADPLTQQHTYGVVCMRLTAWEMVPVEQIQVIKLLKKPLPFTKTTHALLPSVQKLPTLHYQVYKNPSPVLTQHLRQELKVLLSVLN